MMDESPNQFHDNNVTALLYVVDPRDTPKTLELVVREAPADAENMMDTLLKGRDRGLLDRDKLSSFGTDSASYMRTLYTDMKPFFRYAVPIADTVHILNNAVKAALNDDDCVDIKDCVVMMRKPFNKSSRNRYDFKKLLADDYLLVSFALTFSNNNL